MNNEEAIKILSALLVGVHPLTGEILPGRSPYNSSEVVLALRCGIGALRLSEKHPRKSGMVKSGNADRESKNPNRAGTPWTRFDDTGLETLCGDNASIESMCATLKRTAREIRERISEKNWKQPEPPRHEKPARSGKKWTWQEDEKLRKLVDAGSSLTFMADELNRSESSVWHHLLRLGIAEEEARMDNEEIRSRFLRGESIRSIATAAHTTEKAIEARLFYMGIGTKSPRILPEWKKKDE